MRTDTEEPDAQKVAKTWQAIAALHGFAVEQIEGDHGQMAFSISRWNLSRTCQNLADLQTFLLHAGVQL